MRPEIQVWRHVLSKPAIVYSSEMWVLGAQDQKKYNIPDGVCKMNIRNYIKI